MYGGSLPVAQSCARALRSLGHRVRSIDLEPFYQTYREIHRLTDDPRLLVSRSVLSAGLSRLIGESLLATFHLDRPDLVFALAQAPLDAHCITELRKLGIRCAYWFCEDFRVMGYWKEICSSYDLFFHLQPDDFAEPLREAGATAAALQLGFDPETHRPPRPDQSVERDLGFVGAAYHNRLQFLPGLLDLGLEIFGVHWPMAPPFLAAMPKPNEWLSAEESAEIFRSTRVNLNLHSSPWVDGVNPVGDYVNPRTFELAGVKAFQLVDERRDLPRFFEIGSEVETFRDLAECRRKIAYYLEHAKERLEIAERAYRRARSEHTFRHRMQEAVETLQSGPSPLLPSRRTLPTAGSIAEAAFEEPGLAQVLLRLDPEREMDGSAISEAIDCGEGPLTEEEKVLLFMRETLQEISSANAAGQPR
jgi:spore maturation protein CgeB